MLEGAAHLPSIATTRPVLRWPTPADVPALRAIFGDRRVRRCVALVLHVVEADVDPRNVASIRLLEHVGIVREGYLRERYHRLGEAQDAVSYGLLATERRSGE
jgi:RimJ/RimL family protein N-acetyltransferase